jgi:hypothetical protein
VRFCCEFHCGGCEEREFHVHVRKVFLINHKHNKLQEKHPRDGFSGSGTSRGACKLGVWVRE